MTLVPLILVVLAVVALGVAGIVYGGADDSPGLQLLSLVIAVTAVVLGVRSARRRRRA
jgi:hypothetical protein